MFDFAYFKKSADYVKEIIKDEPDIGIILGTGLGGLADEIKNQIIIDYKDIPNFLLSTNDSHAGKLIYGELSGKKVLCLSGRFHHYEGYEFNQLTAPIRLLKLTGVKKVILTSAVGAINPSYNVGDIVILKDHINLVISSPLCGANIKEFGDRFFDTTDMYTKKYREIALELGKNTPLNFHEGVYMYFTGPQFETPAEIRAASILGADVVGMSVVSEALTAAHCSLPILAMSVVTNMASGVIKDRKLTTEEVDDTADKISNDFSAYVTKLVELL